LPPPDFSDEEKKTEDPSDYLNAPDTPKVQNTRKSMPAAAAAIVQDVPNKPWSPPSPPPPATTSTTITLQSTASSSSSRGLHGGGRRSAMAALLLDFPLFTILIVYACIAWIHYVQDQYLEPQVRAALVDEARQERDITYYMRQCDIRDLSTTSGADLFLPSNATADEAYEHQLVHGFTVFRSVLTEPTATALREYALARNRNLKVQDSIYVIENENRWSFGLGTDEPSVTNAITELTSHPQLSDAVEKICKCCRQNHSFYSNNCTTRKFNILTYH
jgi:galactitol-specific phosphotransferase system IIB component